MPNSIQSAALDPHTLSIYDRCLEYNTFSSPLDYNFFLVNTRLRFDLPSYLLNSKRDNNINSFSKFLLSRIISCAYSSDSDFARSLDQAKSFCDKLSSMNPNAIIYILPEPFEIETLESQEVSSDADCISEYLSVIEDIFRDLYDINLLLPPSKVLTNQLLTKRKYCTLTSDRNWRDTSEVSDKNITSYLPPSNRHRNMIYALAHEGRFKSLHQ